MVPIINIGPIAIQAAGFILMLGLLIGTWLTSKFAQSLGTNGDVIENSILIGLLLGILSARIGFLLQNPVVFSSNPLSLLSLTPTMLNAGFGLLVGGLAAFILAQKKHIPLWPTLDTLSPLFLIIFAGIHLANFANGDAYGLPTNLPWGIYLWNITRHPVQIYALFLTMCFLIWLLLHTKRLISTGFMKSGILFNVITAGIGLITLFTRAFVADKTLLLGMDVVQMIGFTILVVSLGITYNLLYQSRKNTTVLISMGSNINPKQNLAIALKILKTDFKVQRFSSIYQAEDISKHSGQLDYLNQVVEIFTNLSYQDLIDKFKYIEADFGRQPGDKKKVPLDIDLLTYNKEVFNYQDQQTIKRIPHPDLVKYRYIALPLAEMAPDFRHPASGLSIQTIIEKLEDNRQVIKIKEVENGLKE